MHPSNQIRFSVVVLAAASVTSWTSDAFAQNKSSQDRGERAVLRNLAASIFNNSGRRPWIPDGRNRTVIVTSPSYVYSNEPSNLVFSPGAYDLNRSTQVNTPPSLAAMYNPTPSTMTPVREQPVTSYLNTTTLRPIGGAGMEGTTTPYQTGMMSAPILPNRPVRDSRGFFRKEPTQSVDTAREVGIAIGRGEVAFEQGRYDDALREFDRAQSLSSEDPDLNLSIGVAAFAMGQFSRAASSLRAGVQLAPNDAMTFRLISRYGDPRGLRAHRKRLEAHTETHPGDADSWLVLTLIRWWDGDARGAIAALDQWERFRNADDDLTDPFRQTLRHWAGRAAVADPAAPK